MPLRCLDDAGASVFAFSQDTAAWAALIADNRRRRHLRTHCCDAPIAAKTSRLGTRFFAHLSRGGCATGDESAEHLYLKALAVAAAQAHGWTAETEVAGMTPAGAPWRADVLATRGRHRVAIEVQWSGQADDETLRRQARYAESGVRGLWLFRQQGFPASKAVPAVRVAGTRAKGLTALGLPVADVLDAAFDGRLRFGIPAGATARLTIGGIVAPCWGGDCGALNRPVDRLTIALGECRCEWSLSEIGAYPALADTVLAALTSDRARGRIGPRFSKMQGRAYLANGCFRCDRLLGEHFLTDLDSRFIAASTSVVIDDVWRQAIDANDDFAPVWSVVARSPASD